MSDVDDLNHKISKFIFSSVCIPYVCVVHQVKSNITDSTPSKILIWTVVLNRFMQPWGAIDVLADVSVEVIKKILIEVVVVNVGDNVVIGTSSGV